MAARQILIIPTLTLGGKYNKAILRGLVLEDPLEFRKIKCSCKGTMGVLTEIEASLYIIMIERKPDKFTFYYFPFLDGMDEENLFLNTF